MKQEQHHEEAALTDHVEDGIADLDVVEHNKPPTDAGTPPKAAETPEAIVPQSVDELAHRLGLDLPEDPEEQKAMLLFAVAAARQEGGEYLETLQRVAAEFDNYRKRVERDESEIVSRASRRIVEQLLPTLDAFESALAYGAQTAGEEAVLEGMRGTHAMLMETLSREGFEPIPAAEAPFDPAFHEAVSGPNEEGSGDLMVAQELRKGYTLQGMVIRPTLVIVEHG